MGIHWRGGAGRHAVLLKNFIERDEWGGVEIGRTLLQVGTGVNVKEVAR
jgi:hypothetical protein